MRRMATDILCLKYSVYSVLHLLRNAHAVHTKYFFLFFLLLRILIHILWNYYNSIIFFMIFTIVLNLYVVIFR